MSNVELKNAPGAGGLYFKAAIGMTPLAGSRKKTKTGWIIFAINAGVIVLIAVIAIALLVATGTSTSNNSNFSY